MYVFGVSLAMLFVKHNQLVDEAREAGRDTGGLWGKTLGQVSGGRRGPRGQEGTEGQVGLRTRGVHAQEPGSGYRVRAYEAGRVRPEAPQGTRWRA